MSKKNTFTSLPKIVFGSKTMVEHLYVISFQTKWKIHLLLRRNDVSNEMKIEGCDDETKESLKKKMKQITDSLFSFEKTNDKNNILREMSDLIFSPEFVKDMNKEKYILPIKNKKMLQLKTLEVVDRTELHKFDYECDAMYKELTETEDEDINK